MLQPHLRGASKAAAALLPRPAPESLLRSTLNGLSRWVDPGIAHINPSTSVGGA